MPNASIISPPGAGVEGLLATIQQERGTVLTCVTTLLTRLVNHPRLAEFNLESLRWIDFGADGAGGADAGPGIGASLDWSDFRLPELGPLALLLIALPFLPWLVGGRRRSTREHGPRAGASAETARTFLEALLRELAKRGHPRLGRESLEAYAERLGARGLDAAPIASAFRAYHEVRFGGLPFDETRRAMLTDARSTSA